MYPLIGFSLLFILFIYTNHFLVYVREEDYIADKLRTLALLRQKGRAKDVLSKT